VSVEPPDLDLPPELIPDLDKLVSEDGKPVDNIYVERQYKLLTEPPYVSWSPPGEDRRFVALANVGWYHTYGEPALVPDVLLSLDVTPRDPRTKEGRSYIQWILGKPPTVVIEIVSDRRGGEDGYKMREYARRHVLLYVIYDPENHLEQGVLRVFENRLGSFVGIDHKWIPAIGLGLCFWEGECLGIQGTWLRWCDREGQPLPTGAERAVEIQRQAHDKLERLRGQLRALGKEPEV
jgi:Uma2 family endonuclease